MRIIVLFNLKNGVNPDTYEEWARTSDIPTVRALGSIAGFEVLQTTQLLGSDETPPYQYIEVLDVADEAAFPGDISTETMQRIAAEFQTFADNPQFLVTRNIETPK